jgi:hypothetical protein
MLTCRNYIEPEVRLITGCSKCGSTDVNNGQSCQTIYVERKEGYWKEIPRLEPVWQYRWVTKSKLVWFDYWLCQTCGWAVAEPCNPSDPVIGSVGYVYERRNLRSFG